MTDTAQRLALTDDRVPVILAAAEIVIDRFGHDKLSLGEVARVSLIPLARIYQFFDDKNSVLGALSSRDLSRFSNSVDTGGTWAADLTEAQRLARVIERFARLVANPSTAYLVLCGPFDAISEEARQDAIHRLASAIESALLVSKSTASPDAPPSADAPGTPTFRSPEALEYAAELVFACFRRSYLVHRRVTSTATVVAYHALHSFVSAPAQNPRATKGPGMHESAPPRL